MRQALSAAPEEQHAIGVGAAWFAGIGAAFIVAAVLIILPFAAMALPVIDPFIPMFATTVCLVEGLTSYFLAIQFRATGDIFLGALAGTYCFTIVLAVLQLLIFPGVFAQTGLLGAGPQSAIWVWVIWHIGYPVFATLALLTRLLPQKPRFRHAGLVLMLGAPAIAALLGYFAIAGGGLLPPLIHDVSYMAIRRSPAGPILLVANFIALAACIRITRLRDRLSLWLAIALLASLGDVVLAFAAGARYTLGWYGGRILSVVSASTVLCVLIFEFSRLYGQLVKANHSLTNRALCDGLTGAFNRSYFAEQFPREIGRSIRYKTPLSLLMIDVDHFKSYNDIHGHQAGDECLIGIVGAIKNILRRPTDFLARYGGEEFVVVLPGTGRDGAAQLIAALRRAVRSLNLPPAASGGAVTVSLGVATFDPLSDSFAPEELIRRADLALYQAKRGGRDTAREFEATPVVV